MKAVRFSLLLAVALLSHVVFAQEQTPPRFMLEVSQSGMPQPSYMPVPEHGESRAHLFARSLFAPRQSSFDESRASALKLVFRLEQDTVRLTASAYFGRFDTNNTPQSLEGLRQEPVGKFSLGLGESVSLQDSETLGFGPVNIKLVSAAPEQPLNPQVVSKVPAIQVELVSQNRAGYEVAIRNVSPRAVLVYAVSSSLNEHGSLMESGYGNSQPVLAPGAERKQRSFCVPAGNGERTQPCDFVLQAALFEDGTYEGDPNYAAGMQARRLVTDILQRRVQQLIDNATRDTALDDAGRITILREQLQALPDTLDKATEQAIQKQLQAEFPTLSQDFFGREFRFRVLSVFRGGKESLLRSLNDYPNYVQSRDALLAKHPQTKSLTIPLSEWLARHMTMGIASEERAEPGLHKK